MKKVFISYVTENKFQIDNLCEYFRQNDIPFWRDRVELEAGSNWKATIRNAIKEGALFLACFSKESVARAESYMNEELQLAIETYRKKQFNSKWFIPIKLNKCEIPPYEIGANQYLPDLHYLELFEDQDYENSLNRLYDVIARSFALPQKQKEPVYKPQEGILEYQAYKSLIEIGNGDYFHNSDMGHPVYVMGALGKIDTTWEYADSPNKNQLFKKLSHLSIRLKQENIQEMRYTWWYDFSTWEYFCKYATWIYRKKHGYAQLEE